jgi:uncharacterized protein YdeI (YjbR/CyaY-like superfamily)
MAQDFSNLKRPRYAMPDFIQEALDTHGVGEKYQQRPAYQQNDYIGWITRAKLPATQQKRLNQMLSELEEGGVYMNMKWRVGRDNEYC